MSLQNAVKEYFSDPKVIAYYGAAVKGTGLWYSEEIVYQDVFPQDDSILELGCGTGRISIGLHDLGYRNLTATDLCPSMVKEFQRIASILQLQIPSRTVDARQIPFDDNSFDGVIYGFNGLMQIPGSENRQTAVHEIFRVLRPGGKFVFTTHDREHWKLKEFFRKEELKWRKGKQQTDLLEFGDMYMQTELGMLFIHAPSVKEVLNLLAEAGFKVDYHRMRSKIANEPAHVRDFADECRFWVVRKP
jgi:ubiquinone/menaquinone biosynthesis C-methylase UbiE